MFNSFDIINVINDQDNLHRCGHRETGESFRSIKVTVINIIRHASQYSSYTQSAGSNAQLASKLNRGYDSVKSCNITTNNAVPLKY